MYAKVAIFFAQMLMVKILFFSHCFALTLTYNQSIVLESFFRTMLEKSEGGYTFYDKKPICINGFLYEDNFFGETETHKDLVSLYLGAAVWKQVTTLLKDNKLDNNLIIHIYDTPDSLASNYIHILFINKNNFVNTVQSNLSLFQYILGPEVTAKKLLNKLTDVSGDFHSILKNDKVLIGILLGFGTQNSLYGGRVENLQEALFAPEQPPFINQILMNNKTATIYKKLLLSPREVYVMNNNTSPSFFYSSLSEEMESLLQKMEVSSEKLSRNRPFFIFGRIKGDHETNLRIAELETAQEKISNLLSSKKFLQKCLQLLLPEEEIEIEALERSKLFSFSQFELDLFPKLIATNIWNRISQENESYIEGFLHGMEDAENQNDAIEFIEQPPNYEELKTLAQAQHNIKLADSYFAQLDQQADLVCVYPKKLYYNIVEKGNGDCLKEQTQVTVHYTITSADGVILSDTWGAGQPHKINLQKTISGFSWGIRDMKIGEVREIYIHPSVGYGIYTSLDKGIYLKVRVQLVAIDEDFNSNSFPTLTILDFNEELNVLKKYNFDELSRVEGGQAGYEIWKHYRKGLHNALPQVRAEIIRLNKEEPNIDTETNVNQDLINRLHWNIYTL